MPIYEFENVEAGVKTLMRFPVEERPDQVVQDGIVLKRVRIPSGLTVGVGAREMTTGEKVLTGFRKLEANGKLRDHPNYLSAETIKKAWEVPDPPEPVPAQ